MRKSNWKFSSSSSFCVILIFILISESQCGKYLNLFSNLNIFFLSVLLYLFAYILDYVSASNLMQAGRDNPCGDLLKKDQRRSEFDSEFLNILAIFPKWVFISSVILRRRADTEIINMKTTYSRTTHKFIMKFTWQSSLSVRGLDSLEIIRKKFAGVTQFSFFSLLTGVCQSCWRPLTQRNLLWSECWFLCWIFYIVPLWQNETCEQRVEIF